VESLGDEPPDESLDEEAAADEVVVEVLAEAVRGPAVSPPGTVRLGTELASADLLPPQAAMPIASAAPVAPVAAIIAMRRI
jgi:hypothetical protein